HLTRAGSEETPRPRMRTDTPRRDDVGNGGLDLGFVLHGAGAAPTCAAQVAPWQFQHIAGRTGSMVVPDMFDSYLLIGDDTAIPAIARRLESLPANRAALVAVEVAPPHEHSVSDTAAQVDVIWLVRGEQRLLDDTPRREMPDG
ncbi:siderophore-interacting protein, partial [Pseudomonas syringae]